MQIRKFYTNGEITIVWEADKCIHSGICARSCPDVFKPSEVPWIKPENSTTEKIIKTVEKCPSGALTYHRNDKNKPE